MSEPVRASILIVNHNGGDKLLRCLASLENTLPVDVEVIVVDNASADGSAEAVGNTFPHLTLIRSDENTGFGGGNNLGARKARGEFLVFLNPDTLVETGWLEPLLATLGRDETAGLVTSKILLMDGRINACGNTVHLTGLTLCRGMGSPASAFDKREEVSAVSGAAFAMRRDLFMQVGGFDDDTFLYMEDTDLSWRVRLAGWRCLYEPNSVVVHDYALRFAPQKVFYQERNRYLMLLKDLRWLTLLTLLPAILLSEVVTWGFVLSRDRANWRNKLHAYWWIVANWEDIKRKRKRVELLRRAPDRTVLKDTTHRLDFRQVSTGIMSKLAGLVLNPAFFLLRGLTLMLVWW